MMDASANVYPALRASKLAQDFVDQQKQLATSGEHAVTRFGLSSMDSYLNPFMAGDLITILGRPQNGKTLLGMYLLDQKIKQIVESGQTNKAVILVTLEVSVERSILYQMARLAQVDVRLAIRGEIDEIQFDKLGLAAVKVGTMPLFIVGHSVKRSKDGRRSRPTLTPNNIGVAIDYIMNEYKDLQTDQYIDPELILIDYLQRLHKPPRVERSEHLLQAVDWSKDLSLWAGSPVVLMVQAKRDVDDRIVRIPEMADGQWTSNIEQSSDYSFGAWMPKTAPMSNWAKAMRALQLPQLPYTERLLFLKSLKQKDGPAGAIFPLYVNPGLLQVSEMDVSDYRIE